MTTAAPSASASATRSPHALGLALVWPSMSSGHSASSRSRAARAIASGSGAAADGAAMRATSGSATGDASFCSWSATSRQTYTGPRGSRWAICHARRIASGIAATLAGWFSHFVKSRTSSPCASAVWIHSIHGRRAVASIGPVPPSTRTGARSHHAQKIVIVACMSPTVL